MTARRAAAVLLMLVAACHKDGADEGKEGKQAEAIAVTCAPARAVVAGEQVLLRGVVRPPPDRDALVAAAVPGRLAEVKVQEGDIVTAGQLLAVVEDPALAAAETEAQAAAGSAAAAAVTARQAETRAARLFSEGVAPRRDVEETGARRAAAEAELQAARARAGLAATQRARAQVRAPRAGTVVRLLRRPGELVDGTAATALAEVADVSAPELAAEAPAAALVRLDEGLAAQVTLDAVPGVSFPGRVVRVSPGVDTATGLGGVRIALGAVPGARPRLGLAGSAAFQLAGRPAVLVPAGALRRSVDGADQVVICAGDHAAVRAVTAGARRGDDLELLGGVAPGERVVADHALGLADGAPLAVRP